MTKQRQSTLFPLTDSLPQTFYVISGGQSGVDRAALDVAIELGLPHGGWCPRGRLAEDGRLSEKYLLTETDSADYPVRTEKNVVDSDGTWILFHGRMSGGTALTKKLTSYHAKPAISTDLSRNFSVQRVLNWIETLQIMRLNVAGPRESSRPGIYELAKVVIRTVCEQIKDRRTI